MTRNHNTALCTVVHRTVKTDKYKQYIVADGNTGKTTKISITLISLVHDIHVAWWHNNLGHWTRSREVTGSAIGKNHPRKNHHAEKSHPLSRKTTHGMYEKSQSVTSRHA